MRILLAGATGAIGRLLVPLLVEGGHQVFGATRSNAGAAQLTAQGAEPLQFDVFDRSAVLSVVSRIAPEALIHQLTSLGSGNLQENARIRREGTRNLVDAALAARTPRLIAQSIAWAYEPGENPADETTPLDLRALEPRATSVRGVVALESTAREVPEAVILRYGTFIGPGTWYTPGSVIAERVQSGRLLANDAVSSFIHVADAAAAALQALTWPAGAYNVVNEEPALARDWVPAFAHVAGVPAPNVTLGREGWERGADGARVRALDFRPRYPSWRAVFEALAR